MSDLRSSNVEGRRTSEARLEILGGKTVRERVAEIRAQQEGCSTRGKP